MPAQKYSESPLHPLWARKRLKADSFVDGFMYSPEVPSAGDTCSSLGMSTGFSHQAFSCYSFLGKPVINHLLVPAAMVPLARTQANAMPAPSPTGPTSGHLVGLMILWPHQLQEGRPFPTWQPAPQPVPLLQLCYTAARSQQLHGVPPTREHYIKPARNPVLSRLEVKEQGLGTVTAQQKFKESLC